MAKNINHVVLANTIQVSLFNTVLLDQIIKADGRWHNVRTKGHAEPFMTAKARVRKDDEEALGLLFAAPKRNYNFNDSNYVNQAEVLDKLLAAAKAGNGGKDVTKKQVQQELEAIKNIFKASAQPEPAPKTAAPTTQAQAEPATAS